MITFEAAAFLLTDDGRALLAQADALFARRAGDLAALTILRRAASPDHASVAWTMAELRVRARAKFGEFAAQMYFVREALEQASSARAAEYHARRFVEAGMMHIADLCGGIGGDALAFAKRGLEVILYEANPARALFAAENARACGLSELIAVVQADVTTVRFGGDAAWFDPARRDGSHRRMTNPDDYLPPLSFVRGLQAQGVQNIGVKIAPAIEHDIAAEYGAELEFLSDNGECKEALLWLGDLRQDAVRQGGVSLRATVLDNSGIFSLAANPEDAPNTLSGSRYLYEPDPAVIRAHLVGELASRLGADVTDPQIAYLVGDQRVQTPFATCYEILDRFPYSRRRLQETLSARQVGRVVIKKRGFPLEPDAVRKQLKLAGPNEITVVLTRIGDKHEAILCRPAEQETTASLSNFVPRGSK